MTLYANIKLCLGGGENIETQRDFMADPSTLPDAIAAEAAAHDLDDVGRRWLEMLVAADPTLPLPTAGAMVSAALHSPLGDTFHRLDDALGGLNDVALDDLTTSQRRVLLLLLDDLRNRLEGLLMALTMGP